MCTLRKLTICRSKNQKLSIILQCLILDITFRYFDKLINTFKYGLKKKKTSFRTYAYDFGHRQQQRYSCAAR